MTEAERAKAKQEYEALSYYVGIVDPRHQKVNYRDIAPRPIEVQIPLVDYFERVKRYKADRWQRHFCQYLQDAVVNRHIKPTWAEFHAEAQLGKTSILSQVFPAWCFGHDPLFRTILAMYNISRSETHSSVIIEIMNSKIHKDIFPNKDGHLGNTVSKAGWKTNARRELNDGQESLNPVGLQSGMTGSGFDWLTIDDPYKEPKEAFSATVFDNLERFWNFGVVPRMSEHSCIAAMFHRYAYDDFGGYLLNTGQFDYVRYATICDGSYLHDDTGQKFEDPLGRDVGEYISERRPASYYDGKKLDHKVWMSMFQGRPSAEEGDFFKVNLITTATEEEWQACTLRARGWDHAATDGKERKTADRSAGVHVGMLPDGTTIVADVFSEQLDTAARVAKQRELAEQDGADTVVVIPKELAASGKDVVYLMEQELQGFTVVPRSVTNAEPGSDAKKRRAHNSSVAVNSGKVKFLPGAWNDRMKRLMRNFGASSSGDDEIDALSDAYNYLYEESKKGLVVRFNSNHVQASDGKQIPADWTVYAGIKITPQASMPNSGVLIARAAQNAGMGEMLFILDEYKQYTENYQDLIIWLSNALLTHCAKPSATWIWIHGDSADYLPTLQQKFRQNTLMTFDESPLAGITETNWYLQQNALIAKVPDPEQVDIPVDSGGLAALRQEATQWGFTDKSVPSGVGQVWDCVRMICHRFRTWSTDLTPIEKRMAAMPDRLKEVTKESTDQQKIEKNLWMQQEWRKAQAEDERKAASSMGGALDRFSKMRGKF